MLGEVERLRELVSKWRTRVPANASDSARVVMREYCADELEAVLRSAAFEEMVRDAGRYKVMRAAVLGKNKGAKEYFNSQPVPETEGQMDAYVDTAMSAEGAGNGN